MDNLFFHVLQNNQSFDNYKSFPLFLDLLQEIHLVLSKKQFSEFCDRYFLSGLWVDMY